MSGGVQEGSELPEWMQDQQHEEKSDGQEMTFEEADQKSQRTAPLILRKASYPAMKRLARRSWNGSS
ncbi:hypothetical protein [Paenibacillus sp. MDMC362]|uniref:hypothetical protein n=1 Tax=Paenibacillus sp. MDMC362 TaxID=2977365 RepID=UPI000DC2F02F|nr:hypothetical protein [Paenibacillus sp. MDMC362]RAR41087.1 hypothetical protein DP091_25610 [Paenibacillus sp. MDMC362]